MILRNLERFLRKYLTRRGLGLLGLLLLVSPIFSQNSRSGAEDEYLVAKGRGYGVLTFSLDQRDAKNEDQLLRQVIDQNKFDYRVTASGGYALKNNFTVGLGFSYGRQREDITFLNQDDEEITSRSVGQDVSFIPNIRKYVPLGVGRFQIFVQTDLRASFGESLQRDFLAAEVEKTEEDFVELRLGVQPGIVLFFTRQWAFEASVGVAGVSSRWTTRTFNEDEANQTKIHQSSIDLKLNLLALNLGVAYYFDF